MQLLEFFLLFLFFITFLSEIGRFLRLVDTPKKVQAFKVKYNIPTGVEIEHYYLRKWHTKRPKGAVVIPMIAFIEGGMQIPMDKLFTALNLNLVNQEDLNRILKSRIFLHKDDQVRAAHIVFGYTPISFNSQSPKYVIKTKDPQLVQINVAALGFLAGPSPPPPLPKAKGFPQCCPN
ncbi:hypothetical protein SO802_008868 [Lithocarpus litseifolius]|uniref:Uncharacterized protein n=1 Tax=Lithocarpus litseifolius TaxID=425828 RepID=A0AAW2DE20_9ROSI